MDSSVSMKWYRKFDSFIEENGYTKTQCDHCVFIYKFYNNDFVILLLYVDAMLIIGHDMTKIKKLKNESYS